MCEIDREMRRAGQLVVHDRVACSAQSRRLQCATQNAEKLDKNINTAMHTLEMPLGTPQMEMMGTMASRLLNESWLQK